MIVSHRSLLWVFVGGVTFAGADDVYFSSPTTQSRTIISQSSTSKAAFSFGPGGISRLNSTDGSSNVPPVAVPAPPPVSVSSTVLSSLSTNVPTSPSSSGGSVVSVVIPVPPSKAVLSAATTPISTVAVPTLVVYTPPSNVKGGIPTVTASIASPPPVGGVGTMSNLATTLSSLFTISSSALSPIYTNSSMKWSNSTTTDANTSTFSRPDNGSYTTSTTMATNETVTTVKPWYPSPPSSTDYSNCTSLGPNITLTSIIWLANTTTVTLTVASNETTTYPMTADVTQPVYCPTTETGVSYTYTWQPVPSAPFPSLPSTTLSCSGSTSCPQPPRESSSTLIPFAITMKLPPTTTVQVTAKNPPVITSIAQFPAYPNGETTKETPTVTQPIDTYIWSAVPFPGDDPHVTNIPITMIYNLDGTQEGPITAVLDDGATVIIGLNNAVIGGKTYGLTDQTITQGHDVFTIAPSSVLGPMLVAYVPTLTDPNAPPAATVGPGGVFVQTPTPTTIHGISVDLGPSNVVIGRTSYSIGAGAPQQTVVAKGQILTVGPQGVIVSGTTVHPPDALPTNYVVVGPDVFSVIGSSLAVIDGTTFTYGMGIAATTKMDKGGTITIGPSGVTYDGTTLGGPLHPSGTTLGVIGGVSVTEIGASIAILNGMTVTIGNNAVPSTTVIAGETVKIGSTAITIGGATLTYPFNVPTSTITAGGITFSEIGSTLVNIGGKTYTVGPGAKPTSTVFNGQTISIGPGGVGFKTTTFTAGASATATGKKKNGAERQAGFRSVHGVLGSCIAVGIGYLF